MEHGRADGAMAKSIVQNAWGEGEVWEKLELVESHEIPQVAQAGNVLIRIQARAIHSTDFLLASMDYFCHKDLPRVVLGTAGVGVVDVVGEGVIGLEIGQRVCPIHFGRFQASGQGTWQQYLEVPANEVFPVPDDISDEFAAQMFADPITVLSCILELQVPEGEFLLQSGSNTLAGRLLIQFAKHLEIKTISLIRGLKGDIVKNQLMDLGADEVVSLQHDVVQRVKEITRGKLAYAAVNGIGGAVTKKMASSVRDGGRILAYNFVASSDLTVSVLDVGFGRYVKIQGWSLADYGKTPEDLVHLAKLLLSLLKQKEFEPMVGKCFPLEDFKEALQCAQKELKGPKVLLVG